MLTRPLPLIVFLLLALAARSRADDWILTPGKGSLAPDKAFSEQVTNQLESRGLDWGPWSAFQALQNPDSIPPAGKHYVSPDKKFAVETAFDDSQLFFVIKNTKTGQIERLV